MLFGIFYYKKHIVNIKLGSVGYYHKTSNLSYFIGNQKYWGMGITTLVIGEIVKIAFEILALSKINASVYENNNTVNTYYGESPFSSICFINKDVGK